MARRPLVVGAPLFRPNKLVRGTGQNIDDGVAGMRGRAFLAWRDASALIALACSAVREADSKAGPRPVDIKRYRRS